MPIMCWIASAAPKGEPRVIVAGYGRAEGPVSEMLARHGVAMSPWMEIRDEGLWRDSGPACAFLPVVA